MNGEQDLTRARLGAGPRLVGRGPEKIVPGRSVLPDNLGLPCYHGQSLSVELSAHPWYKLLDMATRFVDTCELPTTAVPHKLFAWYRGMQLNDMTSCTCSAFVPCSVAVGPWHRQTLYAQVHVLVASV